MSRLSAVLSRVPLLVRHASRMGAAAMLGGAALLLGCEGHGAREGSPDGEARRLDQSRLGGQGKQRAREERKAEKQRMREGEQAARESAAPSAMLHLVPLAEAALTDERSAAAASRAVPGLFYTINDSGHEPELFAFDTTGAARGRWVVRNGRNVDWEALAVGPCGARAASSSPGGSAAPSDCLYIGDVGDNGRRRPTVTLYRIPEPFARGLPLPSPVVAEALAVRYPDGPHNVEAMYVAPDGSVVLITKASEQLLGVADVRPRLYRVPVAAWGRGATVTAPLADSLPEFAGGGRKRMVSDAALSADARYLAVRTYEWLAIWPFDAATGVPRRGSAPALCDLRRLDERQGEGVGFARLSPRTARLAFTSEGADQPLRLADCPLPDAP